VENDDMDFIATLHERVRRSRGHALRSSCP